MGCQDVKNVFIFDHPFINYDLPLIVRTDASVDGCGAILLQIMDGEEMPVAYLSKTFTDAEPRQC